MPWTTDDVDKHKAGLTAEQKRRWVAIANRVLRECESEGGENCEGKAIRMANAGAVKAADDLYAIRDSQDALHVYQPAVFAEPPEWSPFLPVPGVYQHPIYGELNYTVETYDRIISNFKSAIYQDRLPVNAEHDPHAAGAVGWITDMRLAESGAVEVRVEWNDRGRALIEGDRYRYVSAELWPEWTDPVNPDTKYADVAIGMAITTHPFFKERVLAPLVASEAVLTRQAGESGKEQGMSEQTDAQTNDTPEAEQEQEQTQPAAKQQEVKTVEMSEQTKDTKDTQEDPITTQLNEQTALAYGEMKRELAEMRKTLADRDAALAVERKDKRLKLFTDEVRGRSDENDTQWVGDIEAHVKFCLDLAEKFGETSPQLDHYIATNRAHATQMKQSNLFKAIGTSRGAEPRTPQDQIEAIARRYREIDPKLTTAQAYSRAVTENPELYEQSLNG